MGYQGVKTCPPDPTPELTNRLVCAYTNCDGILGGDKYTEILCYFNDNKPDIFFMTETKLAENDFLPHVGNYTVFRKDKIIGFGGDV